MSQSETGLPLRGTQVLVVDDDSDICALLSNWLEGAGAGVRTAANGEAALASVRTDRPQLVVTDLVMGGMDGLRLVAAVHRHDPVLPVMMMSAHADVQDAMRAAHLGVASFLTKPLDRHEVITHAQAALGLRAQDNAAPEGAFAPDFVCHSPNMRAVLERARLVARSDCSVLINGETGTGKEVLAKAIHAGGPRADKPMVSVNCSAIPDQLLESELFGHEKGAFTGATAKHPGLFQAADGGTLFLDEVGDMPLGLQAKLLRVLQDFEVRPVGSVRAVPVDVRIISATHHDLEALVSERQFREDLFYRLSVVPLYIEPLDRRREDIVPLAELFLTEFADRSGEPRKQLSPKARERLATAQLPGNVRQLRNILEQCTVLSTAATVSEELLDEALRRQPGGMRTFEEATREFEERYLVSVLRVTNGNISQAARLAGRNRTEFYKLLGRYNLDPGAFRATPEG